MISVSGLNSVSCGGVFSDNAINIYVRLASLYQQLGRPDAVAAVK